MSLGPDTLVQRDPRAESCLLGEEWVVLDPEGRVLRGLNETGARVWELLEEPRAAAGIAEQLSREYAAPPDVVLAEVLTFLGKLAERSLVSLGPNGGGT